MRSLSLARNPVHLIRALGLVEGDTDILCFDVPEGGLLAGDDQVRSPTFHTLWLVTFFR